MKRSEIRSNVRFLSLVESHEISDEQLDTLIDEGYDVIESRRTWPWAVVTHPAKIITQMGVEEYTIPDFSHVVTIVGHSSGIQLRSVSSQTLAMHHWEEYAMPEVFHVEANKITLAPIPHESCEDFDVIYTRAKTWGCDDDEPPFAAQFHTVLTDWVLHRVWEREEDFDRSDKYRSRFEARLADMQGFYNAREKDRPLIYGVDVRRSRHPLYDERSGLNIKEMT